MDQITEQQTPTTISAQPPQTTTVSPNIQTTITSKSSSENYFARLYSGRMNRRNFIVSLLHLVCSGIVLFLLYAGLSFILPSPITNLSLKPGEALPKPGIGDALSSGVTIVFVILTLVWLVFFVIYYFSFLSRRLHDLNKSGWFFLLNFVPFLNILFQIYFLFFQGTVGANKYGDQPLPRINIKQDILKFS